MRKIFFSKKINIKHIFVVLIIIILIIVMFNYFVPNKNRMEGLNLSLPSNFCTIVKDENNCQTNWESRPWFAKHNIDSKTLAGNPCSWSGSSCQNSTFSSGWGYTYNGGTLAAAT